jgi:putative copper resistance protein D
MFTALVLARAVHISATLVLEGVLIFRSFIAATLPLHGTPVTQAGGASFPERTPFLIALAAIVLISGVAWVLVLGEQIVGEGVVRALTQGVDVALLKQTQFGTLWQIRAALALALLVILLGATSSNPSSCLSRAVLAVLATALTGSLAWSGHGAAKPGPAGNAHLIADVLHLIVAGIWIGGLLPFAFRLWKAARSRELSGAEHLARRFSVVAFWSVAILVATGLVNSLSLVGSLPNLIATTYGKVLLAKLVVFLVMLALAAVNRLYLLPRLAPQHDWALRSCIRLARSSEYEFWLGILLVCIVGVLGILAPPV